MKLDRLIDSSKKFLKSSVLAGLLATNALSQVHADSNPPFSADFIFKYESRLIDGVKNIPEQIRTVPDYADDYLDYGTVTISDDSSELRDKLSIGGRFGKNKYLGDNTRLVFGLGLDFVFNLRRSEINGGNYGEISGVSNGRIASNGKVACEGPGPVGGAYWNLNSSYFFNANKYLRPLIYSELETNIKGAVVLGLGADIWHEKLVAENGWLRRQDSIKNSMYNLADLVVSDVYASLKVLKNSKHDSVIYSLDVGVKKLLKKDLRALGKQAHIDFKDKNWFVGFRIGERF